MAQDTTELLPQPAFPHAETVESILGVPLMLDDKNEISIPEDRSDIRVAAYDYVLNALKHHIGAKGDEGASLEYSAQQLEAIAQLDDVHFLANEVKIAHNVRRNMHRQLEQPKEADSPETPRARFQASLLGKIATHLVTLPQDIDYSPSNNLRHRINDGLAVIAPTGSGKTAIEAMTLRLTGIGEPREEPEKDKPALLVAPTQKLVEQFLGVSGNNTFRRFLGKHVEVTPFYGKKKVHDPGDVRITTHRSIMNLSPDDHSRLIIDEGHTGLQERFLSYIGKVGMRPLLFTATPAYGEKRDLRRYFRHLETRNMRQFIEEGVLNPMRLLSFLYEDNPQYMAAQLAVKYIEIGRSVVVYCQPGTDSLQAQQVARLVNEIMKKKTGLKQAFAASVGNHNPRSKAAEDMFDAGELKVITTCKRLKEGWDADVDVGIFIGPNTSALDLEQKMGRIGRPGKFISEAIELIPKYPKTNTPMVSIWEVLGLENIDPEYVIGPSDLQTIEHREHYDDDTRSSYSRRRSEPFPLEDLPEELLENIVSKQPLRSLLIDGKLVEQAPEDHHELAALAAKYEVPALWLQAQLDRANIPYVGIRNGARGSNFYYSRWYSNEAEAYLEKNPVPKLAAATEMNKAEIARLCNVSVKYVERIVKDLELPPIERLAQQSHTKYDHYAFDSIISIMLAIENTPRATEDDVPLATLYKECGTSFTTGFVGSYESPNNGVVIEQKWRLPTEGTSSIHMHVSKKDAERVREAYKKLQEIPVADKDAHISYRDVAAAAGLSYSTFQKRISDDEEAKARLMRAPSLRIAGKYFSVEDAAQIIERLKPQKLPPYLVPMDILSKRISTSSSSLSRWLQDSVAKPSMVRLSGDGRIVSCVTWAHLQEAEIQYGVVPGEPKIDYTKVLQDEHDVDPERWAYSRAVQANYLDEDALQTQTDTKQPVYFDDMQRREIAKAAKAPAKQVSATPERHQAPLLLKTSTHIPADYVDVMGYLTSKNMGCVRELIPAIMKRAKVEPPLKDANNRLWGSRFAVEILEHFISEHFAVASMNDSTPAQIAQQINKEFGTAFSALHIAHVARSIIPTINKSVAVRWINLGGGEQGPLDVHYSGRLTAAVTERITQLLADNKLNGILTFGKLD